MYWMLCSGGLGLLCRGIERGVSVVGSELNVVFGGRDRLGLVTGERDGLVGLVMIGCWIGVWFEGEEVMIAGCVEEGSWLSLVRLVMNLLVW